MYSTLETSTLTISDLPILRNAISDGTIRGLALSALALHALDRAARRFSPIAERADWSAFASDCFRAVLQRQGKGGH